MNYAFRAPLRLARVGARTSREAGQKAAVLILRRGDGPMPRAFVMVRYDRPT